MVKYNYQLDHIFGSLSDPTRRNILERVAKKELTVSEVAAPYGLTLPAISKHIHVLEAAGLIARRRRGREHFIALSPPALAEADTYLRQYQKMWEEKLDRLEDYLKKQK